MNDVLKDYPAESIERSQCRSVFSEGTKRFSWTLRQRIAALGKIACEGKQTCFGGCGTHIRTMNPSEVACTWEEYMVVLWDKANKNFNTDMSEEKDQKLKMEEECDYGDKMCLRCFNERERRWRDPIAPPREDPFLLLPKMLSKNEGESATNCM